MQKVGFQENLSKRVQIHQKALISLNKAVVQSGMNMTGSTKYNSSLAKSFSPVFLQQNVKSKVMLELI